MLAWARPRISTNSPLPGRGGSNPTSICLSEPQGLSAAPRGLSVVVLGGRGAMSRSLIARTAFKRLSRRPKRATDPASATITDSDDRRGRTPAQVAARMRDEKASRLLRTRIESSTVLKSDCKQCSTVLRSLPKRLHSLPSGVRCRPADRCHPLDHRCRLGDQPCGRAALRYRPKRLCCALRRPRGRHYRPTFP